LVPVWKDLGSRFVEHDKKILSGSVQRSSITTSPIVKWRPDNEEEDEDYDRDHGLAEVEREKSEDGDVDRTQRCAAICLPMVDSFFDFAYSTTDLHMNMNTAFRHEIGILHDIFQTTSSTQHW
jgi:hypothetical protein